MSSLDSITSVVCKTFSWLVQTTENVFSFYRLRSACSIEGDFGLGKGPIIGGIRCHTRSLFDFLFEAGLATSGLQGPGHALMDFLL